MKTKFLQKDFHATILRLVMRLSLVGLLFAAGCSSVHTEPVSFDQSLRSRTVKGPSNEIFNLAERCARREFPEGIVRSNAAEQEIVVTVYSIMRGDAELKLSFIDWPDGRVQVNASATGLGADQQRKVVGKFLGDFDKSYADWVRERGMSRGME